MDLLDQEVELIPTEELTDEYNVIMVNMTPPVKLVRYNLALLRDAMLEDVTDVQDNLDTHAGSAIYHVNKADWVNATLLNGWTQVSGKRTAAYKILATGVVALKGRVSGTVSTSSVIMQLPAGSRPGATVDFCVWGDGTPSLININSSGEVSAAVVHIAAISLDGVVLFV
jgi:hypothetical protein